MKNLAPFLLAASLALACVLSADGGTIKKRNTENRNPTPNRSSSSGSAEDVVYDVTGRPHGYIQRGGAPMAELEPESLEREGDLYKMYSTMDVEHRCDLQDHYDSHNVSINIDGVLAAGMGEGAMMSRANRRKKRKAQLGKLWPNGVIIYEMDASRPWPSLIYNDRVRNAMDIWELQTCLKFVTPDSSLARAQSHTVRTMIGEGPSCSAFVGFYLLPNTDERKVALQSSGCFFESTILHELGHVLGLEHEQSRPDRDNHIQVHPEAVRSGFLNQYNKALRSTPVEHYDITSVMHYFSNAFNNGMGRTMSSRSTELNNLVGARRGLSFYDAKAVNTMYGCEGPCAGQLQCHNDGYPLYRNGECKCVCPDYLTDDCNRVDTGCGGEVHLTYRGEVLEVTSSPGYPDPREYPNRQTCAWLITSPPGTVIDLDMLDMDLVPYSGQSLEVRYNLPGQKGISFKNNRWTKIGSRSEFLKNSMIIILHATSGTDSLISRGFKAQVTAFKDGCLSSPCRNNGTCSSSPNTDSYTCRCLPKFTGPDCSILVGDFSCDFYNDDCGFIQDPSNEIDFIREVGMPTNRWSGPNPSFPSKSGGFFMYAPSLLFASGGSIRMNSLQIDNSDGYRCLQFSYLLYGNGVGELMISTVTPSGITSGSLWSTAANTGPAWLSAQLEISTSEPLYQITFTYMKSRHEADAALDDIHIVRGRCDPCYTSPCLPGSACVTDTSISRGYRCDCPQGNAGLDCQLIGGTHFAGFEHARLDGFTQDSSDNFDWTIYSGFTPSDNTGPDAANTGSFYAYIETSTRGAPGDTARLTSPLILDRQACVLFSYHMKGNDVGKLRVLASTRQGDIFPRYVAWEKSGDQGDVWHSAAVDVAAPASAIENAIRIVMEGERRGTQTGDIAIDDVVISVGKCGGSGGTPLPPPDNFPVALEYGFESGTLSHGFTRMGPYEGLVWSLLNQATPSSLTGPGHASEGSYFAYIETSGITSDKSARLVTPVLPAGELCVSFDYHMYGRDVNTLRVRTVPEFGDFLGPTQWEVSGDQGDRWLQGMVTVRGETPSSKYRVAFEGLSGVSYRGDIALDKIKLEPGRCVGGQPTPTTTTTTQRPTTTTQRPTTTTTTQRPTTTTQRPTTTTQRPTTTTQRPTTTTQRPTTTTQRPTTTTQRPTTTTTGNPHILSSGTLYSNDFESGYSGPTFVQDIATDDMDWTITSISTPSRGTGPIAASNGTFYAFIEASGPSPYPKKVARLRSLPIDGNVAEVCMQLVYHMYGYDIQQLRVRSFSHTTQVHSAPHYEKSGDQGDQWISSQHITIPNPSPGNLFSVVVEAEVGYGYRGDIAIDNLELSTSRCTQGPGSDGGDGPGDPSVAPEMVCGFETGMCDFIESSKNPQFRWTMKKDGTPSYNTGPSGAYRDNYYLYVETSYPAVPGDNATLATPYFAAQGPKCVQLFYHKEGAQTETQLNIQVKDRQGSAVNTLFSVTGPSGRGWTPIRETIPPQTGEVQVVFEVIRGTSYQSDTAIDDLSITDGPCTN